MLVWKWCQMHFKSQVYSLCEFSSLETPLCILCGVLCGKESNTIEIIWNINKKTGMLGDDGRIVFSASKTLREPKKACLLWGLAATVWQWWREARVPKAGRALCSASRRGFEWFSSPVFFLALRSQQPASFRFTETTWLLVLNSHSTLWRQAQCEEDRRLKRQVNMHAWWTRAILSPFVQYSAIHLLIH